MNLSIVMPGIRPERWLEVCQSINGAFTGTWELIIIGPQPARDPISDALLCHPNISHIVDLGSPNRCMQLGLLAAKGDYVMWMSDDGVFLPGSLNEIFDMLNHVRLDPEVALSLKYTEGFGEQRHMHGDAYYHFNHHDDLRGLGMPDDWKILSLWVMAREKLLALGGMDCRFETNGVAFSDLAIRFHKSGGRVVLMPRVSVAFGHMEGASGDHGPVHHAHLEHDMPLLKRIWTGLRAWNLRGNPKLDNWEQSPAKWERRFGK